MNNIKYTTKKGKKALERVLNYIADNNGVRACEIHHNLKISPSGVHAILKTLIKSGEIFIGVVKEIKKSGEIGEYKGYYYE